MRHWLRRGALALSCSVIACLAPDQAFLSSTLAESPQQEAPPGTRDRDITLPNGKSQREEILKAERQQNLKDAAQLSDLAEQLKEELEKNEHFVLSIDTLKKTDEIEKLVKRIRSRLRHN